MNSKMLKYVALLAPAAVQGLKPETRFLDSSQNRPGKESFRILSMGDSKLNMQKMWMFYEWHNPPLDPNEQLIHPMDYSAVRQIHHEVNGLANIQKKISLEFMNTQMMNSCFDHPEDELYQSKLIPISFKTTAIFLILYDVTQRDTFEAMEKYMRVFKHFKRETFEEPKEQNVPVLIIGCKKEGMHPNARMVDELEAQSWASGHGALYFELEFHERGHGGFNRIQSFLTVLNGAIDDYWRNCNYDPMKENKKDCVVM